MLEVTSEGIFIASDKVFISYPKPSHIAVYILLTTTDSSRRTSYGSLSLHPRLLISVAKYLYLESSIQFNLLALTTIDIMETFQYDLRTGKSENLIPRKEDSMPRLGIKNSEAKRSASSSLSLDDTINISGSLCIIVCPSS